MSGEALAHIGRDRKPDQPLKLLIAKNRGGDTQVAFDLNLNGPTGRIEVTDEKGTRDTEYEGHSRNNYYRSGWRPGMVNVGDRITLTAAPTRDGGDGGYALAVEAASGTRF